ncbi:MAG TPA: tetratricopeptide repeat protein [Terriglobales bacterium]
MSARSQAGDRDAASTPRCGRVLLILLLLFVGTVLLYLPALNHAFVNYDDPAYVTGNPHVLQGLSGQSLRWALSATAEANWHPLTWISHMADVQLFGLNPRGHHLVSILVHAVNVALVFLVLYFATAALLRSCIVGALFAVHPLNVECVAWVAERKSLLCTSFLLLALLAYTWYAHRRTPARYALVLLLFALGLAAKPMIVTFPLLLVLWDYWPLESAFARAESVSPGRSILWLVVEKLPFFAMSAASAWVTVYAQHSGGALGSLDLLPLGFRLRNALYSYVLYIAKAAWPARLAVFYPHPENSLPTWKVTAAVLLLVSASALVWRHRQRRHVLVGWLWFLLTLGPVIGIVQVGRQAMADRYAYIPLIGLFILAVWSAAELLDYFKLSNSLRGALALGLLAVYASVSLIQIQYWRNSYSLFTHALQVTRRNGIAEDNLGAALMEMGKPDLARAHFEKAVEYVPRLSTAHYNLAILLQQQNQLPQARHEYELALACTGDSLEAAQAHGNLGFVLLDLNDPRAAATEFTAALQIIPDKPNSLLGRGIAKYRLGDLEGAVADLSRSMQIAPTPQASLWLSRLRDAQRATPPVK